MNARDRLVADLSRLGDEAYFREDASLATSMPKAAMDHGFRGLALGAPRAVPLASRGELLALLVTGESAARSRRVPLHANAVVVAVDTDRGAVLAAEAFPGDPTKTPDESDAGPPSAPKRPEPPEDPDAIGHGDTAGAAWLSIRELLPLPWQTSTLALRVIAFDEISNPAMVELMGPGPKANPLSRAAALEIAKRARAAEAAQGSPRFARSAETPALPEDGAALALASRDAPATTRPLIVHGALRLPLTPSSIVDPAGHSAPSAGEPGAPGAVVKATILVVTLGVSTPWQLDLDIPVWSDHAPKAGEVVDLAFSLDLAGAHPGGLAAGEHCLYLLAGPHVSGPHTLVLRPAAK